MDVNKDKIINYIENNLNDDDRISFEKELENNFKLNSEYIEMKNLLTSLNNLPDIKTSRNFMVSLNSKIDKYESSKNHNWYNVLIDNIFSNLNPIQSGIGALAIIFVIFIGYNIIEDGTDKPLMLSKSNLLDDDNSISLTDSEIDSLLDSSKDPDNIVE